MSLRCGATRFSVAFFAAASLSLAVIGCDRKSNSSAEAATPSAGSPAPVAGNAPAAAVNAPAAAAPSALPKLSQYDTEILPPSLAVGGDGTLHLAFVEKQNVSPFAYFVYYRQSKDGGATWSAPTNLSEVMPGFNVGTCKLVLDGRDRPYVIWRTSVKTNFPVLQAPSGPADDNLVYRVLDGGSWSKPIAINRPGSAETQDDGVISFFALTDKSGTPRVVWNCCPDRFHTAEVMRVSGTFTQHLNGIGNGLIFEATLNGATPKVREMYMAKVNVDPQNPTAGKSCDDFNALDGWIDKAGTLDVIARTVHPDKLYETTTEVDLITGKDQLPAITMPGKETQFNQNPPRILADAAGKPHIIVIYTAGEHPSFADWQPGADAPTPIMQPPTPTGTCLSFQAFQGPGGMMAVLMQTTARGQKEEGDTWLSTSEGNGKWSPPQCITGNATLAAGQHTDTGVLHGVTTAQVFGPGPGAVAFDKAGHPFLALVNVRVGSFGQDVGGVAYSVGGSSTPQLFFYKL